MQKKKNTIKTLLVGSASSNPSTNIVLILLPIVISQVRVEYKQFISYIEEMLWHISEYYIFVSLVPTQDIYNLNSNVSGSLSLFLAKRTCERLACHTLEHIYARVWIEVQRSKEQVFVPRWGQCIPDTHSKIQTHRQITKRETLHAHTNTHNQRVHTYTYYWY